VRKAFLGLWHQDVSGVKLFLITVSIKKNNKCEKHFRASGTKTSLASSCP